MGLLQLVAPTQPDSEDPDAPPAGAGAPYRPALDANNSVVSCSDRLGAAHNLAACLANATYTSYFKFTTDRVILRR